MQGIGFYDALVNGINNVEGLADNTGWETFDGSSTPEPAMSRPLPVVNYLSILNSREFDRSYPTGSVMRQQKGLVIRGTMQPSARRTRITTKKLTQLDLPSIDTSSLCLIFSNPLMRRPGFSELTCLCLTTQALPRFSASPSS